MIRSERVIMSNCLIHRCSASGAIGPPTKTGDGGWPGVCGNEISYF
jgi:hypothetical protein